MSNTLHGWVNINGLPYDLTKEPEYITEGKNITVTINFLVDEFSEKRIESEQKLEVQFEKSGSQVDIKNITEALLTSNRISTQDKTELTITMFCNKNQISIN